MKSIHGLDSADERAELSGRLFPIRSNYCLRVRTSGLAGDRCGMLSFSQPSPSILGWLDRLRSTLQRLHVGQVQKIDAQVVGRVRDEVVQDRVRVGA